MRGHKRSSRKLIFSGLGVLASLVWGLQPSEALSSGASQKGAMNDTNKSEAQKAPRVAGQYLISFEAGTAEEQRAELFKKLGVKEIEKVGSSPLYLIEIPPDPASELENILQKLRNSKGVRYVEPNFVMSTF
jgi:hypothetical protein